MKSFNGIKSWRSKTFFVGLRHFCIPMGAEELMQGWKGQGHQNQV